MDIILMHSHYESEHLEAVKREMVKRGAPVIRAVWCEAYGAWLAVEGCHRIRAAKELGLAPIIKDVSARRTIIIQIDDVDVKVSVSEITDELMSSANHSTWLTF